jgi:hypothetical protein
MYTCQYLCSLTRSCLRRHVSLDQGRAFGPRRRQADHVTWRDRRHVGLLVDVDDDACLVGSAFDDADRLEPHHLCRGARIALVVSDVDRSCQVAGLFALAALLEQRAPVRVELRQIGEGDGRATRPGLFVIVQEDAKARLRSPTPDPPDHPGPPGTSCRPAPDRWRA